MEPWNEGSEQVNAACNLICERQLFDAKNYITRMIVSRSDIEPLCVEPYAAIFCDQKDVDDFSYLEIAIQVEHTMAVRRLKECKSKFFPQINKFLLDRGESLLKFGTAKMQEAFKKFIIQITKVGNEGYEQTLDPRAFLLYFLTTHTSCKTAVAQEFYKDLCNRLIGMHDIRKPFILDNAAFQNADQKSRIWYAEILGIAEHELIPQSSCSIQ
jgi:hypothetical protein